MIHYLIDGHNLIPHIPNLHLDAPDDELQLLEVLRAFRQQKPARIEVFFDKAAPGKAGTRQMDGIHVHFVASSSSADAAIRQRLHSLGRSARLCTVVSSDRHIQAEARAVHSAVISSAQFAAQLAALPASPSNQSEKPTRPLSSGELAAWLETFQSNQNSDK